MKIQKLFACLSILLLALAPHWILADEGKNAGPGGLMSGPTMHSPSMHGPGMPSPTMPDPSMPRFPVGFGLGPRVLMELDLNDEQRQILQEGMQQQRETSQQIAEMRRTLIEQSFLDGFNDAEAENLSRQIAELNAAAIADRARAMNRFYKSLNAEQQSELKSIIASGALEGRPLRPRR